MTTNGGFRTAWWTSSRSLQHRSELKRCRGAVGLLPTVLSALRPFVPPRRCRHDEFGWNQDHQGSRPRESAAIPTGRLQRAARQKDGRDYGRRADSRGSSYHRICDGSGCPGHPRLSLGASKRRTRPVDVPRTGRRTACRTAQCRCPIP